MLLLICIPLLCILHGVDNRNRPIIKTIIVRIAGPYEITKKCITLNKCDQQ